MNEVLKIRSSIKGKHNFKLRIDYPKIKFRLFRTIRPKTNLLTTTSVPNYKTLLRNFFVPFYKTLVLFPTTLIIYLHACPYLLYIFFFNQQ